MRNDLIRVEELLKTGINVSRVAADLYALQHIEREARIASLTSVPLGSTEGFTLTPAQKVTLVNNTKVELLERESWKFVTYTLLALMGEMRYFGRPRDLDTLKKIFKLWKERGERKVPGSATIFPKDYEIQDSSLKYIMAASWARGSGRHCVQLSSECLTTLGACDSNNVPYIVRDAIWLFGEYDAVSNRLSCPSGWPKRCGGIKWAKVAKALWQGLTGAKNVLLFMDTLFSIQHNCGHIFDKLRGIVVASQIKHILDVQRTSNSLRDFLGTNSWIIKTISPNIVTLADIVGAPTGLRNNPAIGDEAAAIDKDIVRACEEAWPQYSQILNKSLCIQTKDSGRIIEKWNFEEAKEEQVEQENQSITTEGSGSVLQGEVQETINPSKVVPTAALAAKKRTTEINKSYTIYKGKHKSSFSSLP